MTTGAVELQRHARTYHGFTLAVKWFCIDFATLATLLIGWFATPLGFAGAAIMAAIVFAVGVWAMNHGLAHSTENDNHELAAPAERQQT
jgi:hypothetical protein